MPTFYTEKERKAILKQMHLDPDATRANSTEAARILSWRAKEEYKVEHEYNATAVRKHARKLNAQPAIKEDGTINPRQNTYDIKRLFEIDINPGRTNTGRWNTDNKVLTR